MVRDSWASRSNGHCLTTKRLLSRDVCLWRWMAAAKKLFPAEIPTSSTWCRLRGGRATVASGIGIFRRQVFIDSAASRAGSEYISGDAGNPWLHANGSIASVDILGDRLGRGAVIGMAINQNVFPAGSAQQIGDRHVGHLALDVSQGDIDGGNGAHRHRPPAPIGPAIEILPDILDPCAPPCQLGPAQRGPAKS